MYSVGLIILILGTTLIFFANRKKGIPRKKKRAKSCLKSNPVVMVIVLVVFLVAPGIFFMFVWGNGGIENVFLFGFNLRRIFGIFTPLIAFILNPFLIISFFLFRSILKGNQNWKKLDAQGISTQAYDISVSHHTSTDEDGAERESCSLNYFYLDGYKGYRMDIPNSYSRYKDETNVELIDRVHSYVVEYIEQNPNIHRLVINLNHEKYRGPISTSEHQNDPGLIGENLEKNKDAKDLIADDGATPDPLPPMEGADGGHLES